MQSTAPYEWTLVEFNPASGHSLYMRMDRAGNDFVLVETIKDSVSRKHHFHLDFYRAKRYNLIYV